MNLKKRASSICTVSLLALAVSCFQCKSWGQFWGCTVGGIVVNLTGSGLVLKNPASANLSVPAGSQKFAFADKVLAGTNYSVTLANPAAGQQCIVRNGNGVATVDVTDIVVACYDSGSFDISFGSGGQTALVNIAGDGGTAFDIAQGLVLDSSGRILVTGNSMDSLGATVMIVCRLNSDGNLDHTFAPVATTPGCATFLSGTSTKSYAIAVDPATNGIYTTGTDGIGAMILVRFTDAGVLDTTFNGSGHTTVSAEGDEGRALSIDSNGSILVGGRSNCGTLSATFPPALCKFTVWRFTSAGALDTSLADTGIIQVSGAGVAFDIRVQADGKILATGFNNSITVRRYTQTGSPDTSFNGTGSYLPGLDPYNGVTGNALAQDDAGNILVAGQVDDFITYGDMAIWKLKSDGTLDASFGVAGFVTDNNAAGATANPTDSGHTIVIDAFGRILVAGVSCNKTTFGSCTSGEYTGYSIVVWRYNPDGTPDTTFSSGSHFKIVDSNIMAQNILTTRVTLKLDSLGRIVIAGGRDDDAVNVGDAQNLHVYRIYN